VDKALHAVILKSLKLRFAISGYDVGYMLRLMKHSDGVHKPGYTNLSLLKGF